MTIDNKNDIYFSDLEYNFISKSNAALDSDQTKKQETTILFQKNSSLIHLKQCYIVNMILRNTFITHYYNSYESFAPQCHVE